MSDFAHRDRSCAAQSNASANGYLRQTPHLFVTGGLLKLARQPAASGVSRAHRSGISFISPTAAGVFSFHPPREARTPHANARTVALYFSHFRR